MSQKFQGEVIVKTLYLMTKVFSLNVGNSRTSRSDIVSMIQDGEGTEIGEGSRQLPADTWRVLDYKDSDENLEVDLDEELLKIFEEDLF